MLPDEVTLMMLAFFTLVVMPLAAIVAVCYFLSDHPARGWRRMPSDPVKRLHALERGRRAQAEQYDPSRAPWTVARRNESRRV